MTVFKLSGANGEFCELKLVDTFDFPNSRNFEGGFDFLGELNIDVGEVRLENSACYFSTLDVKRFYEELNACYKALDGRASYRSSSDNTNITIEIDFSSNGVVKIFGEFANDNCKFSFDFESNQSYFVDTLNEMREFVNLYC